MLPKAERVRQSWVSGFLNLNLWLRDKLVIFIEAMGKVRIRHPDVSTLYYGVYMYLEFEIVLRLLTLQAHSGGGPILYFRRCVIMYTERIVYIIVKFYITK